MEKSWLLTNTSFKAKIIGKLLGDGCITIQKGRKPRFQFTHTSRDYSWANYSYEQMNNSLPLNPPKYKSYKDSRLKEGYSFSYYVQSRTSSIITYLRSQWYPSGTKIVPFKLLNEWFTKESLAWWYMDDGHLKLNHNKPQKIILSTDSFTPCENIQLSDLLKKKYKLQFRLDKQNRLILYNQFQIYYFLYLVTPYLHESMHRKIVPYYKYTTHVQPRRTTIYLPSSIILTHPTREINFFLKNLDEWVNMYKKGLFYSNYFPLINPTRKESKSYQITLSKNNLSKLHFLKETTGLNYSELTRICFTP
ncbi:endonuclease [Oceanobacillus luteolus]|uniref:endonuclease n=1 Tax=Oceanobacillus luteolus TaxID=1274358 RepID=UPI00203CB194|nr:endonuclease [Oceanobacillus luteolus]MCM3740978.1 endonuclease [Oceanobacillus luteolus]